jgi:polysaccharide export outer membrane protein
MRKFQLLIGLALASFLLLTPGAKAQQQAPQPEPNTKTVFINGEIAAPGVYKLKPTEGVLELIARAGGATPSAALTQVTVCRNTTTTIVNVFAALRQNGARPEFVLHDGDFVIVPQNAHRVLVGGEVMNSGSFAIPENGTLSVAQALALAGGLRSNRAAVKVIIVRQTANGKIDPRELFANATDPESNEPLQSGDIVIVIKPTTNRFGPTLAPPIPSPWLSESH